MARILTIEETIELFKRRPKEYEGGYIYVPLAGKPQPTSPAKAKATLRRKKKPEGDR